MVRLAHFLWWLGPWADSDRGPEGVSREIVPIQTDRGEIDGHWYTPSGRMHGSWILGPGLTYRGVHDPRFIRFAEILAAGGNGVFAPDVPDFCGMQVTPRSITDFQHAFDTLWDLPGRAPGRPAVWSVSTSSVMALHLAGHPDYVDKVAGLVTWGGYGEWRGTVRFCLTGKDQGVQTVPPDRDHQPVTYINLLEHIAGAPEDREAMLEGLRAYVRATWYHDHTTAECDAIAHELADGLPEEQRPLFLTACGVGGEASWQPALDALEGNPAAFVHLDAVDTLDQIQCPVWVVHAADDPVVPASQRFAIAEGLTNAASVQVHLTGLYGHTGADTSALDLGQLRAGVNELKTLFHVAHAAAYAPLR